MTRYRKRASDAARTSMSFAKGLRAELVPVYWRKVCIEVWRRPVGFGEMSWGAANEGYCCKHVEYLTNQTLRLPRTGRRRASGQCSHGSLQGTFYVL